MTTFSMSLITSVALKWNTTGRSVNASALNNPTKNVAETSLGDLEGRLLLLVLYVDTGSVLHQQLGCFHALFVTGQVAGKR